MRFDLSHVEVCDTRSSCSEAQYDLYRRLSKEAQAGSSSSSSSGKLALAPPLQPPSSAASSSFHAASSSAGPSRSTTQTPRVVPTDEYPTTPTPNRRRSSSGTNGSAVTTQATQTGRAGRGGHHRQDGQDAPIGDDALRRSSKRPAPSPQSASRSLFITPKKPRPSYSGPIVDPNPINPFASTPPRPAPFGSATASGVAYPAAGPPSSAQSNASSSSKFVHANSPRKLRELLESNSLRKVRERNNGTEEITPRTKARLRLTGDFVTPVKDKAPRRRRGERAESSSQAELLSRAKGKEAMRLEDDMTEHSEDENGGANGAGGDIDEDEFGPSPIKPGLNRTFTELLQSADEPASTTTARAPRASLGSDKAGKTKPKQKATNGPDGRASHRDISTFFGKTNVTTVKEVTKPRKAPIIALQDTSAAPILEPETAFQSRVEADTDAMAEDESGEERLSTPPPLDPAVLGEAEHSPSRSARREKMVSFSDDEVDEWDPEGGNVRQKVFITGTKRNVRRRGSLSSVSSEDEGHVDNANDRVEDRQQMVSDDPTHEADEDPTDEGESVPDLTNGDTAATPTHSSPRSSAQPAPLPPLLSLLSLRSPPARGQSARMNDLRVKAIFNPDDAARLRAAKKGQDIYVAGQVEGDGDEDGHLIDQYQFDGVQAEDGDAEGDDDWDDDCDGWKRTGLTMDDEEW